MRRHLHPKLLSVRHNDRLAKCLRLLEKFASFVIDLLQLFLQLFGDLELRIEDFVLVRFEVRSAQDGVVPVEDEACLRVQRLVLRL